MVAEHDQCPVFIKDGSETFPETIRYFRPKPSRFNRPLWQWAALAVTVILVAVAAWLSWPATPGVSSTAEPPSATMPAVAIAEPTGAIPISSPTTLPATLPPTSTVVPPSATPSPTATNTALPPQIHALDEPVIVNGQSFIIHRTIEGEQLTILFNRYKTSMEALVAINFNSPVPSWAGRVIVLAPGLEKVEGALQPLDPYEVLEDTTIEDLAVTLNVDADLFMTYTNCQPGCRLSKGDWVLVPRIRLTPNPN